MGFNVTIELDEETKRRAEAVFATSGVSASTVIQKLFTRIAEDGVLPFEPFEPNATTIAAMEAADRGELVTVDDIDGLFASLNADD
jgi:DNA-damage-inducible protein J